MLSFMLAAAAQGVVPVRVPAAEGEVPLPQGGEEVGDRLQGAERPSLGEARAGPPGREDPREESERHPSRPPGPREEEARQDHGRGAAREGEELDAAVVGEAHVRR